jgi:hypothetical protein
VGVLHRTEIYVDSGPNYTFGIVCGVVMTKAFLTVCPICGRGGVSSVGVCPGCGHPIGAERERADEEYRLMCVAEENRRKGEQIKTWKAQGRCTNCGGYQFKKSTYRAMGVTMDGGERCVKCGWSK